MGIVLPVRSGELLQPNRVFGILSDPPSLNFISNYSFEYGENPAHRIAAGMM